MGGEFVLEAEIVFMRGAGSQPMAARFRMWDFVVDFGREAPMKLNREI